MRACAHVWIGTPKGSESSLPVADLDQASVTALPEGLGVTGGKEAGTHMFCSGVPSLSGTAEVFMGQLEGARSTCVPHVLLHVFCPCAWLCCVWHQDVMPFAPKRHLPHPRADGLFRLQWGLGFKSSTSCPSPPSQPYLLVPSVKNCRWHRARQRRSFVWCCPE